MENFEKLILTALAEAPSYPLLIAAEQELRDFGAALRGKEAELETLRAKCDTRTGEAYSDDQGRLHSVEIFQHARNIISGKQTQSAQDAVATLEKEIRKLDETTQVKQKEIAKIRQQVSQEVSESKAIRSVHLGIVRVIYEALRGLDEACRPERDLVAAFQRANLQCQIQQTARPGFGFRSGENSLNDWTTFVQSNGLAAALEPAAPPPATDRTRRAA